ncbi:MAG: amino acid ABC transporter substrate-binding protein [Deltaproteobacteria bacterium]|nr:amino acid ABC transporter substrate-binding protein [Candidatus Anaeroferrophillacea bacterium]
MIYRTHSRHRNLRQSRRHRVFVCTLLLALCAGAFAIGIIPAAVADIPTNAADIPAADTDTAAETTTLAPGAAGPIYSPAPAANGFGTGRFNNSVTRAEADADDDGVIHVGVVLPLTGPQAEVAERARRGFALGVEEINAAGRPEGARLQFHYLDSAGTPDGARRAVAGAIEKFPELLLLTGGITRPEATAAAKVADEEGLPFIVSSARISRRRAGGYDSSGIFQLAPPAAARFAALEQLATGNGDIVRLAILFTGDICATEEARRLRAAGAGLNVDLAVWQHFSANRRHLDDLARHLEENPVEIVFACGAPTAVAPLVRVIGERFPNLPVTVFGAAFADPDWLRQLGPAAGNVQVCCRWSPFLSLPGSDAFAAAYTLRYNELPGVFAAEAHAAAHLIGAAVAAGSRRDRAEIIRQLEYMALPTVIGEVRFTAADTPADNGTTAAGIFHNRRPWHLLAWNGVSLEPVDGLAVYTPPAPELETVPETMPATGRDHGGAQPLPRQSTVNPETASHSVSSHFQ